LAFDEGFSAVLPSIGVLIEGLISWGRSNFLYYFFS